MSTFGKFIGEKEYQFDTPQTKRPMLNYLWNDHILSGVNQTGGGNGAYGAKAMTYIDSNDKGRCSVIRDGNRYFYIKDMDNDTVFNPGWFPAKTPVEDYKCIHGLGYSKVESTCHGVKAAICGFVGKRFPCEIWQITLTNQSEQKKNIRTFSFVEFQLEGYTRYSDYMSYVYGRYYEDENLLVCNNDAMEKPHDWYDAFMASDCKPTGFDTSKDAFMGVYGDIRMPQVVEKGKCSNSLAACEYMVGVLEHTWELEPGETKSFHVLIGSTNEDDTAKDMVKELLFTPKAIEMEFANLLAEKEAMTGDIVVKTPDEKVNCFGNQWLKQQVQLCAEIGRDGCKGFRDQLQDAWAVAAFNPKLARGKILETLRYEYANGTCERGWLPVTFHIYSDAPIWIPLTLNGYMKETGDTSILDEVVPYFDEGEGTVLEHTLVALRRSSEDLGARGLVHSLEGDWNDSLNMTGLKGKGESVWTSIALHLALKEMAEIAKVALKDLALEKEMLERAEKIGKAINEKAWDGDWYLAAINDLDEKVGSHTEAEGKVYLNSQTWAILAGIATGDRKDKCLQTLDTLLDSPYGPLTLYPTYTKFNDQIGRLTSFVPGIWENGTPYCHGGTFKIVADCVSGRGNEAYKTMLKIFPDSDENSSDLSGCEPYALTNMYFGPDNPRKGQTLFAWVTGTAGWMFRAITQYTMGFFPGYDTVTIDPCIPSDWKSCELKRVYKGSTYYMTIENPNGNQKGVKELYVDGKLCEGNSFAIFDDHKDHKIVAHM